MKKDKKPSISRPSAGLLQPDNSGRKQEDSVSLLLSRGYALQQEGDLAAAENLYRGALAVDPEHADALMLLGSLCLQQGRWEESAKLLDLSLGSNPPQPAILYNRGLALQELKRYEEALASYERAIALHPNFVEAHNNCGNVLRNLHLYDKALESYGRAITLNPSHAKAHLNQGMIRNELRRYDEALVSFDRAIDLNPNHAEAYYNRGMVMHEMSRYDEALANYNRAIALNPVYWEAYCTRGLVLHKLKKYTEALASYDRATALQSNNAGIYYNRGVILQDMMRYEEAIADYNRAIALAPQRADAYNNRAVAFNMLGSTDKSIEDLNAAIKVDPGHAKSYCGLSFLKALQETEPVFKQLEALYAAHEKLPEDDQVYLGFAMGRALESQGRYDEAFDAYAAANRLYHRGHPFDEERQEAYFRDIVSLFNRELFKGLELSSDASSCGQGERVPVFIVGMPRSGTTLIEQILSSHHSLFGAGELTTLEETIFKWPLANSPIWEAEMPTYREMGRSYLEQVWKRAPQAGFITDKMPTNYLHLGLIHLMLPNAKIIHSMRDPMDSCFSCFAMRFSEPLDYAYDLGTLGRYYRRYIKLMGHWHDVLPPGRVLDVRYENMVANPEQEARRLLEYIGLPWDPACLKFYENKRTVSTASVTQVRKPIYSSSVSRWKHFEGHLAPLLNIVGEFR